MPETYEVAASDETLEQEIKDLEDSRAGKTLEEVVAIDAQIQAKLEELHALPPMIVDNTILGRVLWKRAALQKNFL